MPVESAMCRLESRSYLRGLGQTVRGCVRQLQYVWGPGRPKDVWRERFRGGYRIIGTRARFIPEAHCDPVTSCPVIPAFWAFKIFFAFRDGTQGVSQQAY